MRSAARSPVSGSARRSPSSPSLSASTASTARRPSTATSGRSSACPRRRGPRSPRCSASRSRPPRPGRARREDRASRALAAAGGVRHRATLTTETRRSVLTNGEVCLHSGRDGSSRFFGGLPCPAARQSPHARRPPKPRRFPAAAAQDRAAADPAGGPPATRSGAASELRREAHRVGFGEAEDPWDRVATAMRSAAIPQAGGSCSATFRPTVEAWPPPRQCCSLRH